MKKRIARITSLALVLVLLVTSMCLPAVAASVDKPEDAPVVLTVGDGNIVSISDSTTEIDIPVKISFSDATTVVNQVRLEVELGNSGLELKNIKDRLSKVDVGLMSGLSKNVNTQSLAWTVGEPDYYLSQNLIEDEVNGGTDILFWITVKAKDGYYNGNYNINVKLAEGKDTSFTYFAGEINPIDVYFAPCAIELSGGKDVQALPEIEVNDLSYNGNVQNANPVITGPTADQVDWTGTMSAKEVGEYTIIATGKNGYNGTRTATWKITEAEIKSISGLTFEKTYDGTDGIVLAENMSGSVTFDGAVASEDVSVVVKSAKFQDVNAGANKAVDVTLELTGEDAANYKLESATVTLNTGKINAKAVEVVKAADPVAFTGEKQTIYAETDYYTVKNGEGTNAGDYTAEFTLKSGNYIFAEGHGSPIAWTIAKAEPCEVTAAKAETLLYSNTEDQTLNINDLMPKAVDAVITAVEISGTNPDVVEKSSFKNDVVTFNLKELEEKEYAFNVKITFNSDNYKDGSTYTVPYSVIKKTLIPATDLVFPENAAPTAVFTGEAFDAEKIIAAEYKGALKDYEISYKFYQNDAPATAIEVGTYQLVATFEHATHYGTATVDFVVTKKPVTVKSATVAAKTYGDPLETTVSNLVFDGVVSAYPIAADDYTATDAIFANGNAGEQNVTFKLALETKNYKYESETATVKGIIDPAKVTVTVADIADQVYTGSKIEPKPVVTYGETELKNVAYTYEENVDCGTYTVKVNATTGGNYTFDEVPVQFKIVAAEPVVAVADLTKDYDGKAVNMGDLTLSAKFNGAEVDGTWSSDLSTAAKADAGTYTVTVSFDPDNANLKTVEKVITVKINSIDAVVVNDIEEDGKTLADVLTIIDLAKDYVTVEWFDKDGNKIDATTEIEANTEYLYSVKSTSKNFNEVEKEAITPYEVSTGIESNINIKSGSTKHGSVSINPLDAEKGDKVVVTVKPKTGYEVDEVTVTTSKGKDVAVKSAGSNKYVFVMPAGQVTLEVTYKKADVVKFLDVADNAWYHDSVYAAVDMGLFTGVSDNYFQPDGSMTRAMLVTVLWRLEGSPAAGSADFADVANGSWYDKAVAWANEEGIVTGISDASFAPNAAITREQMATMLYRYAKYLGLNTAAKADLSDYADADKISAYAVDAMAWAVRAGLINGVTADTLAPAGTATRAQVATILVRFVEKFL